MAAATSWPTQKAGRHTVPQAGRRGTRGALAQAARRQRGCRAGPPRPGRGARGAATYQKCPAPGRIQVRAINEGRSILVNLNEYDQGRSRATRNFGFVAIAKICAIFSQVESITKP